MKKTVIVYISKNCKFLLWCGITALFGVLIVFMSIPPCSSIFMYIAGEQAKLELMKFVGWGISGLIAIWGVVGIFKRAEALEKQNKINKYAHDQQAKASDKQHEMVEKGHVQERFKVATELLGSEQVSVRIATFYKFYRLATVESDLREHIFDILCAHLRQTTKDKNYQKKEKDSGTLKSTIIISTNANYQKKEEANTVEFEKIKPTEEVQSLLKILFKLCNKGKFIFNVMFADLESVNLQEANLQGANLQETDLRYANLQGANLQGANLQKTDLRYANLKNADLKYANLKNADLQDADMKKTDLKDADLQDADMKKADLKDANLQGAYLQDAILQGAYLQKANLKDAYLQGAYLQKANLKDADLQGADLFKAMINQKTTMPDNWENMVKKDEDGETGVIED